MNKLLQLLAILMLVIVSQACRDDVNNDTNADLDSNSETETDIDTDTVKVVENYIEVEFDPDFPRIVQYTWQPEGAVIEGQPEPLSIIKINDKSYSPTVTSVIKSDSASYTLAVTEVDITIEISFTVTGCVVSFNVTNIIESGDTLLTTFEIPNHSLLSVRNDQEGSAFAGAQMHTAVSGTGDTFEVLDKTSSEDSATKSYMYGIVNNKQLAGSIWTNSVYDHPRDETAFENGRILKRTVAKDDFMQTGIWSGIWLYRASGMTETEPLPAAKIVIANDQNEDNIVNWQDAAIAYRDIMNVPIGSEEISSLVIQRIVMNFASQATNPFLMTLDETKRLYLATDGLGQRVLLKGYQSEGHDSGHPDYGGHINERAGGLVDINHLISKGHNYNASFGVHINAQEAHPEAKAFSESLVSRFSPGWNWIDQAYIISKRNDATTGNRLQRLKMLNDEVPELDFIYLDVWYQDGWESRQVAREINSFGWSLTTEFPNSLEYDSNWIHWSVDYDYGGLDYKGINSNIVRFIRNHQKDCWIARHPLLGGTEMADYEGWQGRIDFDHLIELTFNKNLPSKYLQHFEIIRWLDDAIDFTNDLSVNLTDKDRTFTKDDKTILQGDSYLLPWNPHTEEKLYHWNQKGGETTWRLPASWSEVTVVQLYQLSDKGRTLEATVDVTDGEITLTAQAGVPYVIYKDTIANESELNWGEETHITDPGFNSGDLSSWTIEGSNDSIEVERNAHGQYELVFSSGDETSVCQIASTLSPGTWSASVHVEILSDNRRASIGIKDSNDLEVWNYLDHSSAYNYIAADSKNGTNMQRLQLMFEVPEGQDQVLFCMKVDTGSTLVVFDNVRIVKATRAPKPKSAVFAEDFEHTVQGWHPFVKGPAGGINDPRTHLSERHDPFTQRGWNGKIIDDVLNGNWSLKSNGEAPGIIYRTVPQNLRFEPNESYTVQFNYELETKGDYVFVIGDGKQELSTSELERATEPTTFEITINACLSGESWIGIKKTVTSKSDFVLDDLVILPSTK